MAFWLRCPEATSALSSCPPPLLNPHLPQLFPALCCLALRWLAARSDLDSGQWCGQHVPAGFAARASGTTVVVQWLASTLTLGNLDPTFIVGAIVLVLVSLCFCSRSLSVLLTLLVFPSCPLVSRPALPRPPSSFYSPSSLFLASSLLQPLPAYLKFMPEVLLVVPVVVSFSQHSLEARALGLLV